MSAHSYSPSTAHPPGITPVHSIVLFFFSYSCKTTIELQNRKLPTQLLFPLLSLSHCLHLSPASVLPSSSFPISLPLLNPTQPSLQPSAILNHQLTPSLRLSSNQRPSLANGLPSGQYSICLPFFSSVFLPRPLPTFFHPRATLQMHCPSSFLLPHDSLPLSSPAPPPQAGHVRGRHCYLLPNLPFFSQPRAPFSTPSIRTPRTFLGRHRSV